MRFYKLLRYDFYHGVFKNCIKLIPLMLFCVAICYGFANDLKLYSTGPEMILSTGNYFALLFSGMAPYIPSPDNQFQIPLIWLFIHTYLIWFLGSYASSDLKGVGQTVLLRCGSRIKWWNSKTIFCIAGTTVYYLAILLSAFLMGMFLGTPSLLLAQPFAAMQMSAEFVELRLSTQLITVYLLPFLVLLTMSLVKLVLDFVFTPAISMITVVVIYIASIYYNSPFLIGEYSMLMRHRTTTDNGIHELYGIALCAIIIAVVYLVGRLKFKSYDILDNKEI